MVAFLYNQICWIVLVALLLQGCPKKSEFVLYNNANIDVSVKIGKQWMDWKQNTSISLAQQSIMNHDEQSNLPVVVVKNKEQIIIYELFLEGRSIPDGYLQCRWGESISSGNNQICFQLEDDLSLYLVKDSALFPVIFNDHQPSGFPIQPQHKSMGSHKSMGK